MTEFIGFIISILSLIYFTTQQNSKFSRNKKIEEDQEEQENEPFLEWIEGFDQKSNVPPRPPPFHKKGKKVSPIKRKENHSSIPVFKQEGHSKLNRHADKEETRHSLLYRELEQPKVKVSRAQQAIKQLPSLNHLVIYQEIMGPPKSMRPDQ